MEKAILYNKWGGPEELEFSQLPDSLWCHPDKIRLSGGEILVQVEAISVNPIDWKILSGSQKAVASKRFPRIFGTDFSGTIYRAGKKAEKSGYVKGAAVMGMVSPLSEGSGRQWIKIKASHCIILDQKMSMEEGASLPEAGVSALLATVFSRRKKAGRVLVFGATGGVGSLALQILNARGWDVTAVCRAEQKEALKKLGCHSFVDRHNWQAELEELPSWDAIVDCPGAIIRSRPSQYLRRGGVYSPVFIPDPFIPWQILRILLWFFTPWTTGLFVGYASKGRMNRLKELIDRGAIKPLLDSSFEAGDIVAAVEKSIQGGSFGKLIIRMEK